MTSEYILKKFSETGALLDGHFLLRSGLHSPQYFQCALLLQHMPIAEELCGELARKFDATQVDTVIAPAMGGLVVGQEIARVLKKRFIFAEKEDAGKLVLRRGFTIEKGERFIVAEDVVTKGGRVVETMEIVKQHGGIVTGVGAIVDRSAGKVSFGVPFRALLKLDIFSFEPAHCPICRVGELPLVKPGSK
jgi:orotate phosphoribosyltransferase